MRPTGSFFTNFDHKNEFLDPKNPITCAICLFLIQKQFLPFFYPFEAVYLLAFRTRIAFKTSSFSRLSHKLPFISYLSLPVDPDPAA